MIIILPNNIHFDVIAEVARTYAFFLKNIISIEKTIENLEKQGYLKISSLDFAPAIHNRRVVFMFEKDLGLIELVED